MVRCHKGVARWLVTCVLVMLRGKAKNQNIIFFYTRNHELSSGPALKDVHAMPEPRWNRAAMKGALVVVGGVRRLLEAIFRSIGRETSDLAVNPEWKRLASERCGGARTPRVKTQNSIASGPITYSVVVCGRRALLGRL